LLTDSTYYNVALYNGKDWLTPKSPLLHGTARARLLKKGILKEADIKLKELQSFQKVCLFNALNDFGEVELGISEVY
jgi:4-amino-4-deoxychorismate lyase